jgi:EAL domain-containing protein (putative c-di-GMP-specific phosphodiesterase class I)
MLTRADDPANNPKCRVLIADDELALVRLYGRILTGAGYDVVTATDGLSALALLEHGAFDVVLTDVAMPGADGMELLCAARRRDRRVPVVIMTGAPTGPGADAAAANGALLYLTKPLDLRSLVQIVSHACQMRRASGAADTAIQPRATDDQGDDLASCRGRFEGALRSVFMVYQPILRHARELFGYEALVRSAEPTMTEPLAILAAAERLGRVHDLGRVVRERVAAAVSDLPSGRLMFVNLHPADLTDESLFSPASPLSRVARRVVLELTERASLDEFKDVTTRIADLRALGFRIAIDDLGAGYASLTAFAQVQPEVVKLDRALVHDVHLDPMKRLLVDTLVTMSQKLGLQVVAEGIETVEERTALSELGCDLMQGYLFAGPDRAFLPLTAVKSLALQA